MGKLTQKTTPGGTEAYDYDVFGNLRSVNLANGDIIEYLIDPKDRRIGKKVNGTITQTLLYLGQLNPIAELYPDNSIKNLFIYAGQDAQVSWSTGSTGTTADKSNVPSAMERYDESGNLTGKYRIISNHLGSVIMAVNAETGDIAQEIEYDVWGNVLNDTNPNFQPFYFAGGIYDTDTKLTRFGARDYDAETGRWTAKDPIGFNGGLTSLYDYVGGDPVNFVDPSGLQSSSVCSALRKIASHKNSKWLDGSDLYSNDITTEIDFLKDEVGVPRYIDGVDLAYTLVVYKYAQSWGGGLGDDIGGLAALIFFSVYIPMGSGFSADSWKSWWYDVKQNSKGALLGNEMSVVYDDIDAYIDANCGCGQ